MFADSSTRSGARSIAWARERNPIAEVLLDDAGERGRLIEMARLCEVPRHELDVAQPATECRNPLAGRLLCRLGPGRRVERRARGSTPPLVVRRIDALACRLMNRSALLLFAIAVRSSIGMLRSSSRVRSTRTPSRPSIADFTRRAIAQRRCPFPSRQPRVPFRAVTTVTWIERDGADMDVAPEELKPGGNSGNGCVTGGAAPARPCRSAQPTMSSTRRMVVSTGSLLALNPAKRGPT